MKAVTVLQYFFAPNVLGDSFQKRFHWALHSWINAFNFYLALDLRKNASLVSNFKNFGSSSTVASLLLRFELHCMFEFFQFQQDLRHYEIN
mmetsp:Transcript_21244/g.36523  ORF Transcript_21244/g.36523 Transcript_21244/m.36523 type:complete len:91 (-) Transcript_21244:110-382(-)